MESDDLKEAMTETAVVPARDRAERFYDRIRRTVARYGSKKGGRTQKTAEYLLLVPDVFNLLWRLANDPRVSGKNKVLLGSGIAYYLFPLDFMPDIVPGVGFLDDLVFAVYVLNKMLADTEAEILREHWAGDEDVLVMIRRVIGAADTLVSKDFLGYVKKMVKR
jgi:uncharacterized membrane protein YkvA (DUF1232 family)